MSEQNLETVRRIYDGWGRGDFGAGIDRYDPLILFVLPSELPDSGTYLGLEQLTAYMRQFLEPWQHVTIALEEAIPAGDSVLATVYQSGTGNASGAAGGLRYFQLWSFRAGRVIRLETIRDPLAAYAAAGLPQPSARPST